MLGCLWSGNIICPGDICPYQQKLSYYWPDFEHTFGAHIFRGLNISGPTFFFWQTSFDRNIFWTNFFLGRCLKEDWKMSEKCLYLANCNMMWQLNDLSELVSTFDKLLLIIESLCQLLTTCDGLCWLVTPFKEMRWLLSNCGYFCWLVLTYDDLWQLVSTCGNLWQVVKTWEELPNLKNCDRQKTDGETNKASKNTFQYLMMQTYSVQAIIRSKYLEQKIHIRYFKCE